MTLPEIINHRITNNPLEIQSFLNENSMMIENNNLGISFHQKIELTFQTKTRKVISFEHYRNKVMDDTIIIYRCDKLTFFTQSPIESTYIFLEGSINSKRLTLDIVPVLAKQILEILNIQIVTHKTTFVYSNQNIEIVDKLIV